MKYLPAMAIMLLAGGYSTVLTGVDSFEVNVTVYERGTVVSDMSLGAVPGDAIKAERYYGPPDEMLVWLALEIDRGEAPDTVRVAGSIQVDARVAEPEMTLSLGSEIDIDLDGEDLIVRLAVSGE